MGPIQFKEQNLIFKTRIDCSIKAFVQIRYMLKNSLAVKEGVVHTQNGPCEESCEIQGSSKEMAVMVVW